MKASTFGLLASVSIAVISLAACSQASRPENDPSKAASPSSAAPVKRPGGPLWNLEYVGGVFDAYKRTSFDAPPKGELNIGGWAVDQDAKTGAGAVEIDIDGTPYAAEYGKPRPDVANAFHQPAYAAAGYLIKLNVEQFKAGPHTAYFRVFSNDRKNYWEVGPYTITFQ